MKRHSKIIISIIAMVLVLTSVITFNIIKKHRGAEEPEIMVSRGYEEVSPGDEKIDGTDFVTFDAFYLRDLDGDGYAEKIRGSCREIGQSDTIYMDLNVLTNGTLKNGKITINGKNFDFASALVKDSVISQNYIGQNIREIRLNDVSSGTQKLIFGMSKANLKNNINNYTVTDNSITLTGTHVADNGTETPISKTVYLTNDWYGTTRTELDSKYLEQEYDINEAIDVENQVLKVKFKINPKEKAGKLVLKNQHIELDVPELAGYKATEVLVDNSRAAVNYEAETHKATIDLDSIVDGSGNVNTTISRDITYEITYVYPLQAFIDADTDGFTLNIPVDATYTGYNNRSAGYENPYVSNVAEQVISVLYGTPHGENALVEIKVGEYLSEKRKYVISKEKPLNIYNNVESETEQDLYTVRWILSTGTQALNVPVVMYEPEDNYIDQFMDINAHYTDMTAYTKNVGIYFSNQNNMLGADGYINVYNDETNELIHTFTAADWGRYNANNPYLYDEPVAHIRVETSNVLKTAVFEVYNVKELNDLKITTDYERPDFDKLAEIYSHVHAKMILENGDDFHLDTASSYASYMEPYSEAKISISENNISNQQTTKNFEMKITTASNEYIKKKFANGVFLIKYPEEIIDLDIKSITTTDNNVTIAGYDTYEEDGIFYTKIYTSNDVERDLDISVLADITADPRRETVTKPIELYYYNPTAHNYYESTRVVDTYDVNDNENTEEYVGKTSTNLNIYAPSTLLTSQTATDYDDLGSVAVAPQDAIIDKENGERTANINVNITNNYSNTISEVKIVGKIPFEGNTYQLNGSDLGSMYDTQMTAEGIVVPEELRPYATIYYSEKENVTQDINARKNAWTTTPADMSKVKSYLIDLGDYVMPVDNSKTFTYTVTVPAGLNYNDVSYADHAVYFCLDTNEGKLNTQTEPNKLGIKIALKYDLEITKYQKNKTLPIAGVVFSATDSQTGETKVATTYSTGIATIKNLYVEKEYKVKEIKTDSNYILDDTETTIKAHVVDGHIELEVTGGNFKTTPVVEEIANGNDKVKTTIENEVKYNVELDKTQLGTDAAIQGIRFELTDYNGRKKKYVTNNLGKLVLKQLEPGKQYTLTEIDSKGHYVKNPVTFMMIRDGSNNLQFNVISGELDSNPQVDVTNEVPVVRTGLVNEKIPTYTLKVTKKEKDTETVLQGAQFKLEGENKTGNTLYTSNENGQFEITDLYNYVDGKDITGEYTLTEVYPGVGYILNDTPVKFKVTKDGNNFTFDLIEGEIREEVANVQIDTTDINNPVVNITIDNEPVFTLTKVDAETGEPLEGVTFEFTDMKGNDILDANGNFIGYNELTKVTLTSGGDYPWTQNNDGTWQSGNYEVNFSTSTLTSDEFTIDEGGVLSFDWSVSSQGTYYDYLYYTITNTKTGEVIGGTSNKIGGTSYGTVYDDLKFNTIEEKLKKGSYVLKLTYRKDDSGKSGLDRGFVKNIKITDGTKGIKTDSNGKIRLSLKEGLYKAIETQSLEGYAIPDLYTGIGIGNSKPATLTLNTDYEMIKVENFLGAADTGSGFLVVSTKGSLIKFDYDGNQVNKIVNNEENRDIIKVGDYYVICGKNFVEKIIENGTILWRYEEENRFRKVYNYDNYIYAVSNDSIYKFDLEGNLIWKKNVGRDLGLNDLCILNEKVYVVGADTQFYILDLEGNIMYSEEKAENIDYDYFSIEIQGDELIAVGDKRIDYNNSHYLHKFLRKIDESGTIIFDNDYYAKDFANIRDIVIANDKIYLLGGGSIAILNQNYEFEKSVRNYVYNDFGIVHEGKLYSFTGYNNLHRFGFPYYDAVYYGTVAIYDMELNKISENVENIGVDDIATIKFTNDGYLISDYQTSAGSVLIKYGYDNGGIFVNNGLSSSHRVKFIEVAEQYILGFSGYNGSVSKYDLNGNLINPSLISGPLLYNGVDVGDGFICFEELNAYNYLIKYDYDGNKLWQINDPLEVDSSRWCYFGYKTDSGVIYSFSTGLLAKFDFSGNLIWKIDVGGEAKSIDKLENDLIVYTTNKLIRLTQDGEIIYSNQHTQTDPKAVHVISEKNEIVTISRNNICRYDYDGNLLQKIDYNRGSLIDCYYMDGKIYAIDKNANRIIYYYDITEPEIVSSNNITVENNIKKLKVTTRVEGIGGMISGMDENPYEEVKYKENSIKNIIATPLNGYKVSTITVNGEKIDFTENSDGSVTLDKFYEMTEDKEVVVSFVSKNKALVINKLDNSNDNPLANARFNIKQIETRSEPSINNIAGNIFANGKEYTEEEINLGEEVTDAIGEMQNQDGAQYYFTLDGTSYVSNNNGIDSSTANSYFKIDLSSYTGDYAIVVNANVSSESGYDYGYATITESTTAPTYDSSTGQFIKIAGTSSDVTTPKDYIKSLEGGKEYYLHIGYRKDSSSYSGQDKFYVNSIKLYNANVQSNTHTYNFIDNGNGGYESNNQGKASTVANSYIPIDLTGYTGKYNLIVNANVSSQNSYDYGYATITTTTSAPDYNTSNGQFIKISGTYSSATTPTDYTTILEGGKLYYLHFGYYKNESTDSGEDKFTINSINISLYQDDFVNAEIVTNSDGQASIELEDGRYEIVEVEAPEGYTLNTNKITHDFIAGGDNEITVKNNPQVDLIVHHYIKGTTTPVADDEYIKGDLGAEYSTSPRTDLDRYQLEEDGNGGYILPNNASGTFTEDTQVVTYYYVLKPLELIVHHYLDGTQDSVVPDEHSTGQEGESYTTHPATAPELDDRYILVESKLPENASGTLTEPVTEVTYYYKTLEHKITTEVDGIGGTISGQGLTQYEVVVHGEDSVKDIIAQADEGFQIESITINGNEIDLPEGNNKTYTLDKFINMTEDKHIVVKFEAERVNYKVTKIWVDNNDAGGKRPEQLEIQLYDGNELVDSGLLGEAHPSIPDITYNNTTLPSSYPWTQNVDRTWQSSNYKVDDSTSKLITSDFEVTDGLRVAFDWSVSSESPSYDYLYYTITNVDSGATIGGTSNKIGGTSYGTQYDSLSFDHVTVSLQPGTYKMEFTYTKDGSVSNGLDRGYVKNLKLEMSDNPSVLEKIFNVPLVNASGNLIEYTIKEKEINTDDLDMYTQTSLVYGENEATITNTFTVPDDKIDIPVTKIWNDNSNEYGKRPEQIKLVVKDGNTIVREQVIDTTDNETSYIFYDLPVYNELGDEIEYTVDEVEVNNGDLYFYSSEINQATRTITNTFTVPDEKIHYYVRKVWDDNNDEAGKRPDQVGVNFYNGVSVVESDTIEGLGYEIPEITFSTPVGDYPWAQNNEEIWQTGNYNIDDSTSVLLSDEFEVGGPETLRFEWAYSGEAGYDEFGYTIINAETEEVVYGKRLSGGGLRGVNPNVDYGDLFFDIEGVNLEPGKYKIQFTYSKDSSDFSGQDSSFVRNVKLISQYGEYDTDNEWRKVYELPLYDYKGDIIDYTVLETELNENDLFFYDSQVSYDDAYTATITNTFRVPDTKISIPVTKVWEDNSNANSKRPAQIKLQVKNGSEVVREQVIDVSGNSQTYTFEGLDEYDSLGNTIPYTIDEVEVNADDLKFYSKEVNQETKTITNTFTVPEEKTSVDVTKKWSDNSNGNNTRPAQIKLQVKNGTTIVQEQVVDVDNATNEKVYTFNDLAMYDNAGQVINYTVDEVEVNSGDLVGYTKGVDGLEITNTLKKHKITTEVNGIGGTISGQGENPYEEVNHKGDSVKDIVITPAEGYKIKSITINDVPQDLPGNLEQPYTMSKFTNMTEDKHVVVEFELVEHVITTEVDGEGGTISGQGSTKQNPYETVLHGNDSVKDIVITPETGYKINSITINNVEQDLPNDVNSAYTLPKFTNMTEDKHIVVSFTHSETSVIVKHQTEDGTDLVPPETIEGVVGDDYTTSPRNFDDYELKTTPDNAEGTMTVEQIEVIYVYSKVLGKVTVTKQDKLHPETKINGAIFKLEKLDANDEVDTSFEAIEKETTGEGENKGKAEFENLEVGKYRITEIKAPEGYELTGEPVDVEVTKAQRNIDIVASDRMTIDLPATGGINYTIIISVIGFGIMLSSAGILVFKKKQN